MNDPEVFKPAPCARPRCLSIWALWCRDCNLVFCGIHILDHACKIFMRSTRRSDKRRAS